MGDDKNQNEQPLNVEQRLKQTADELQERIRYYSESEEGQEEVRQTVYQAGRIIGGAASLVWTIAKSVTGCMARKACDYYEAGQQAKDGNYKAAGKKIAEMQVRRVKGAAKAAATAAGTVCNGVKAACTDDTKAAKKFRRGLRNCAVIGGTILVASEAVDAIESDDGAGTSKVEASRSDGTSDIVGYSDLSPDNDDLPDASGAGDLLPLPTSMICQASRTACCSMIHQTIWQSSQKPVNSAARIISAKSCAVRMRAWIFSHSTVSSAFPQAGSFTMSCHSPKGSRYTRQHGPAESRRPRLDHHPASHLLRLAGA